MVFLRGADVNDNADLGTGCQNPHRRRAGISLNRAWLAHVFYVYFIIQGPCCDELCLRSHEARKVFSTGNSPYHMAHSACRRPSLLVGEALHLASKRTSVQIHFNNFLP